MSGSAELLGAEQDAEPLRYGLVHDLGTHEPLWLALHECVAIAGDVARSRSPPSGSRQQRVELDRARRHGALGVERRDLADESRSERSRSAVEVGVVGRRDGARPVGDHDARRPRGRAAPPPRA